MRALRSLLSYPEHPRLRLGRSALFEVAPIPGRPAEFALLNYFGRPLNRVSGPKGPAAALRQHRSSARSLDLRFAFPSENGSFFLFDESTAPWLSPWHERAHRARVALVLRWSMPSRAARNARARTMRRLWAVVDGGLATPRRRS